MNVVLFVVVLDGIPDYLGVLGPYLTQAIFFFVLTFPVGLYFTLTEASKRSASIGKRKTGLKVQGINGQSIGLGQSALRAVVKLLPWEIAHAFIWQMQYVFYLH